MDPFSNPLGDHFRKFFRDMRPEKVLQLGLSSHLETPGLKKCKVSAYELLKIYLTDNFSANPQDFFTQHREYLKYESWIKNSKFSSR